jgi:hypothetical protein
MLHLSVVVAERTHSQTTVRRPGVNSWRDASHARHALPCESFASPDLAEQKFEEPNCAPVRKCPALWILDWQQFTSADGPELTRSASVLLTDGALRATKMTWMLASSQRYWQVTLTVEISPSGTVPVPFVTTQVRVGGFGWAETVTE